MSSTIRVHGQFNDRSGLIRAIARETGESLETVNSLGFDVYELKPRQRKRRRSPRRLRNVPK